MDRPPVHSDAQSVLAMLLSGPLHSMRKLVDIAHNLSPNKILQYGYFVNEIVRKSDERITIFVICFCEIAVVRVK